MRKVLLAVVLGVAAIAFADPVPGVKVVLELKPGPDNPRPISGERRYCRTLIRSSR